MPHQKITPGLAEKLCFTAVATTSYAPAAAVVARWGVVVDDTVIHQQVQRAGARAEQQAQVRLAARAPLAAPDAPKPPLPPAALVIMMDGWRLRHRGADWGQKPAAVAGERGAWQECKSAVIYHLGHAAKTAGERGLLVEKFVVAYVGEPLEFGRPRASRGAPPRLGRRPARLGGGRRRRVDLEHRDGSFCRSNGRGSSRSCTSCATAAKPTWCKPCRTCRRGARNARNPCRRPRPKKSTALKTIATICIMKRGRPRAARWAAARWNPCAANCKAASNEAASSGPNRDAADSGHWKSPAVTTTGMKSGS